MKSVRGIIFDCDGVLFASREANLAYYNAILERLGEAAVTAARPDLVHLCHTRASPQVFEALLGAERVDEALAVAGRLDFRQFIPALVPEPALAESLARLATARPLAVATNRGDSVHGILDHFGLRSYFRTVITSRDVSRPKPFPDMLLLAAERLRLAPDRLLFVGDSELDRDAARRAVVPFVAYRGLVPGEPWVGGHRELAEMVLGSGAE